MSEDKNSEFLFGIYERYAYVLLDLEIIACSKMSEEDRKSAIKKGYRAQSLVYHSDRNEDKSINKKLKLAEKFKQINQVYIYLLEDDNVKKEDALKEFISYIESDDNQIAVDFLSNAQIEKLRNRDTAIFEQMDERIPEQREQFYERYKDFIDIATQFLLDSKLLSRVSSQTQNEAIEARTFFTILETHWRRIIITLFAEENRDDFYYRRYMNMPIIWHKMAYRKLLNPLKWFAALVLMVLAIPGSCLDYASIHSFIDFHHFTTIGTL